MPCPANASVWSPIQYLIFLFLFSTHPSILAATVPPITTNETEVGVEIGVLSFLGTDLRLTFNHQETPWTIGLRYLDIKDDFINESAVGLPGDISDKHYTKRVGPYVSYEIGPVGENLFYLSSALYQSTMKLVCGTEHDSDSGAGLYFGAGLTKRWNNGFGYNIGVLISPFVHLKQTTPSCSSDAEGDIDINASVTYTF